MYQKKKKKKKENTKQNKIVFFIIQMMMGSIGYIISGLISTVTCACACKLCKKKGLRWIRRLMENYTEDSQPEGQVEEVSFYGAVIEIQEFFDIDENTYEVPMSPPIDMDSVKPAAPVGFVSTSPNIENVHLHPVSCAVLPAEKQQGRNDQTLPKTVEEEHDPYPNIPFKGWLPPVINIASGSINIPLKEKKLTNSNRVVACCIMACRLKK